MMKISSMMLVEVACIILFTTFSMVYLLCFQADLLNYCQHVLSHGATHYSPWMGASIITVLALLVRFLVKGFFPRKQVATPALSFLPSALAMGILTGAHTLSNTELNYGNAVWWTVLILALTGAVVWFAKKVNPFENNLESKKWRIKNIWINIGVLSFVMLMTAFVANTSEREHLRLRADRLIAEGEMAKAVEVTNYGCEKDSSMLMLRAYALLKQDSLGNSFFVPFVDGASSDWLFPTGINKMSFLFSNHDYMASVLGGRGTTKMSCRQQLELLSSRKKLTKQGQQYLLNAYLLDRDLDSFIKLLPKVHESVNDLPRNYAEAVVQYLAEHDRARVNYDLQDAEERYEAFCNEKELLAKKATTREDGSRVYWHSLKDLFGDTYWYYYSLK